MAKGRKRLGAFSTPELSNPSKTLLANIRFASIDEKIKTIAITSSWPNEGKTSVATNLAVAIATSGKRVLVMECDMRRRCLAQMLHIHTAHGLYSVLAGEAALSDAIMATDIPNLSFMDAEPKIPNPPDILATKRFAVLVDSLRAQFDYVIFDTPPVLTFVDAAIIGNLADCTLLVIRQGSTKRSAVAESLQQLDAANARVIGTVLTFCEHNENDYYYSYYDEEEEAANRAADTFETVSEDIGNGDIRSWSQRIGIASTANGPASASERRNALQSEQKASPVEGQHTDSAADRRQLGQQPRRHPGQPLGPQPEQQLPRHKRMRP